MSEKNTAGKRAARERLAEERKRQQAADKRVRLLKVLGASAAVLGVVGLVGYAASTGGGETGQDGVAGGDGPAAEPLVLGEETAPATLTVYQDFRCAACGQLERELRDTVHQLEEEGALRTEYHPVSILGGDGSRTAGNAAACADDAGHLSEYQALLFDNQPTDGTDAFADPDFLTELAGEVSGLDTPEFRACVADDTHGDWVDRTTGDFLDAGHTATPTVLLNGEPVFGDPQDPLTADRLAERVAEIVAEAEAESEAEAPAEEENEAEEAPAGGEHGDDGAVAEHDETATDQGADPATGTTDGTDAGHGGGPEPTDGIDPDPAPEAGADAGAAGQGGVTEGAYGDAGGAP